MDITIYLEGTHRGRYGAGTVVYARRDESPEVRKGQFYTIETVVESEMGACAKHLRLVLVGCNGDYSKKTFVVNEQCVQIRETHPP